MGLIYLGAALVVGGAVMILVSYHEIGSTSVADLGKILALFGFVIYVIGRIRYRRIRKTGLHPDTGHHEGRS